MRDNLVSVDQHGNPFTSEEAAVLEAANFPDKYGGGIKPSPWWNYPLNMCNLFWNSQSKLDRDANHLTDTQGCT